MAEAMLEKALQTVSAKKYVEFEHEIDAKHRIKAASDLELMLEDQHLAAHKDAVGAQDEADLVESINANYEDEERHRDLSVVHAAHHIEQDTEKVLINAQHTANLAMDDLLGAEGTIMLLEEHEKALKQALDEFHHIKRDTYYDNLYKKYTSM